MTMPRTGLIFVTALTALTGWVWVPAWGLAHAQADPDSPTQASSPSQLAPLLQPDGSLSPAWRFVGFPKKHADLPPTRFEAGSVDQQAALKVTTEASYGTWVHPWLGTVPGQLQWRWRLDEPLSGG